MPFSLTHFFRILDAGTYEKLHRTLVINLGKCSLILVEKATSFDMGLLKTFCCATLTEYVKSSMKDRVYKVTHFFIFWSVSITKSFTCFSDQILMQIAHSICSSFLKLQEDRFLYIIDILDHVARECKVTLEELYTYNSLKS